MAGGRLPLQHVMKQKRAGGPWPPSLLLLRLLAVASFVALPPPGSRGRGGGGAHALLLHEGRARRDGVLPDVAEGINKLKDTVVNTSDTLTEQTFGRAIGVVDDTLQDVMGELDCEHGPCRHKKAPLMTRINLFRAHLCWKRPNLLDHEDCMRFLGLHCGEETSGEGLCRRFTSLVKDGCVKAETAETKERLCKAAYDLTRARPELAPPSTPARISPTAAPARNGSETIPDQLKNSGKLAGNDRDGDGWSNDDDAFPDDPKEWHDLDQDGIGDNADQDRDGDGVNNEDDAFPDEYSPKGGATRSENMDRQPPSRPRDRDGDDVADARDAFPDDPNEWQDSDNDGIGDNEDQDRDGDGQNNEDDEFPDDPTEWRDTDGDGYGDNIDEYPLNRHCHSLKEACLTKDENTYNVPPILDPTTLNKLGKPLPEQGYNEVEPGPRVEHDNYHTWTGDWQDEWPMAEEPDRATIERICDEHPNNSWCQRHQVHGQFHR